MRAGEGDAIERRSIGLTGLQSASGADMREPALPDRHMADLVTVNDLQQTGALAISGAVQPSRDANYDSS